MSNDELIWIPVSDYPGYYVSNYGNVKRIYANGKIRLLKTYKVPSRGRYRTDRGEYDQVSLSIKGKVTKKLVHRIVAKAFLANYSEDLYVNHIDGWKNNHKASNLEMVTAKQNLTHAASLGLMPGAFRHYKSFLDEKDIVLMRKMASEKVSQDKIARIFGMNQSCISRILSRKTYKNV